jgi:hypothetical protein
MATIEQVLVIKIHCPPCPREGQKNYIPPWGRSPEKNGGGPFRYNGALAFRGKKQTPRGLTF